MKTPYEKYLADSQKRWAKLTELQETCLHPKEHLTTIPKNIGDYSPEYIYEFKCRYCGKWWVEDQ